MKKNIAIITLVVIANLLALNSIAQSGDVQTFFTQCEMVIDHDTTSLLADETTISIKGNEAKIECYNETVYNLLMQKFGSLSHNNLVSRKNNKAHAFVRAVIILNKKDAQIIQSWAKSNL